MRLALALGLAATTAHISAGQQIVTQEELIQAGVTRLGDIFHLTYGWIASSTDGYAWDVAALGTALEQEPAWKLFVNETPVDLRMLGRANINVLPVPTTEICQVELHTLPAQIGGVIAPAGAVHIRTCTPQTRMALHSVVDAGNETGDPGPYKYIQEEDTNVDRTGPTAQGAVALGGQAGHVRFTGQLDEHHATDLLIRPRVRTLYRGEKDARIHHRALGLDGAARRGWGSAAAWVAVSRLEDLTFFSRLGLEVPASHDLILGHLSGSSRNQAVRLKLSVQRSHVSTRPNPHNVDVRWEQTAVHGLLRGRLGWRSALGARSSILRTWGLGMNGHQLLLLHTVFLHAAGTLGPGMDYATDVEASLTDDQLGWQMLGFVHHKPRALRLTLLWQWQAPAATQGYTYWASLGYRPRGLPQDEAPVLPPSLSVQSADLVWQTGESVQLSLTGGFRRHTNIPLTSHTLHYDSLTTGLRAAAATVTASGTVAAVGGMLTVRPTARFSVGVFARYTYPVSSYHTYRAAWHTRSLAQLRIRFMPNSRFSLYGRLRYRGPSSWPDYAWVSTEAPDRYDAVLPGAVLGDLTIQKRLWHQRLRLSASLHNLLNQSYRTHPGGSVSRLTLHLRVQIELR